ncbi:MAG: hypothetical protein Q4P20_03515, partial [Eubacteriales bacterium]|nr:hypothetical protein [Eubacteriales bacterium]
MNSMMRRAAEYLKKQRDNKRWRRMVLAMAMVVALGTFGVLMLPGEAITNKNMLLACPLQVHTHTEDCYDAEGTLTCGQADYVIHTHDENCYDAEGELVCTLPEIAEHTHDASCYDEDGNLTCTQEEVIAHTHSDSCYEDDTLICGQLETTVHQHEDACFQEVKAQADDTGSAELPEDNETDETADAEAFNPLTALISFFSGDDADDGIAAQATEQTINVGDSAILKGTSGYEGKEHKWSVDKDGIVSFTDSMTNELTVTGVNTGTVTITHTYYEKKNKTATETFVVTVIDEDTTLEAEENLGYTVTVKGNKKVLTDDVTLHVEDYAETAEDYTDYYNALVADLKKETSKESITKNDFDFLHMYHIYLTKEGVEGEYVPDGNVNLQVTITYDNVPENWSKVNWVGHYKKNNGTVSGVEISDGSASSTGVKKIKVSGNSITFHIQSFSVFPIAALAGDDDSGDTGDTGESGSGTGTSSSSSGELTSTATGANGFQISTAGYYRSTNGARMKKIIEPTDIEDVFKVTVTIEREPTLEELAKVIETSGALVLQSNGSIDSKITEGGTVSSYSAQSS